MPTLPDPAGRRPRALIYARHAQQPQQEDSDAQLGACTAWAEQRGYDVVGACFDVAAGLGPLAHRPGGARLLERLAAGEAHAVVVSSLDRLSRDHAALAALLAELERGGVAVISLSETLGDAARRPGFYAWLAELARVEREQLAERTRLGRRAARARRAGGR